MVGWFDAGVVGDRRDEGRSERTSEGGL